MGVWSGGEFGGAGAMEIIYFVWELVGAGVVRLLEFIMEVMH